MGDDSQPVVSGMVAPRKEDVLFTSGEDWRKNACLTHYWDEGSRWTYKSGFRRAAAHLAEQVCGSESEQDLLVYPIVYLYRHHLELVLKSIIHTAFTLLQDELSKVDRQALEQHDLTRLWKVAERLLVPVCELEGNHFFPLEDLEGIKSYIDQIHEHDPDGQRFRYSTTKTKSVGKGRSPSLNPELELINIRIFAAAMEKLADYLERIEDWIGYLQSKQDEMQQDDYGF